jgi:hypothetical protein
MTIDPEKFVEYWKSSGVILPDPTHYPRCFMWYVKLYQQLERNKSL